LRPSTAGSPTDPAHLGAVLQTVRNVDGVFDVERVTA